MEVKELKQLLILMELPVAYHSFKASGKTDIPNLPYIIYLIDSVDTVGADNKVKYKENRYIVELYTALKSIVMEEKLEQIFYENEIYYEKFENYIIDSENMYQISYHI